jgi:hypothetical protein
MKVKIPFRVFFILSAYSENTWKVYMEDAANSLQFRVVCGTQSRLRIRGKNLCAHGEDAKRHKTGDIFVNNGPT